MYVSTKKAPSHFNIQIYIKIYIKKTFLRKNFFFCTLLIL